MYGYCEVVLKVLTCQSLTMHLAVLNFVLQGKSKAVGGAHLFRLQRAARYSKRCHVQIPRQLLYDEPVKAATSYDAVASAFGSLDWSLCQHCTEAQSIAF